MNLPKIDTKDKKILYQLDKDARLSNSQIGKKVGLSKEVVNYRIKRLESNDVIKGYYAVIDSSRLGYFLLRAYISLMDASIEEEKEILDYAYNHPKICFMSRIDGIYDIGLFFLVKDAYEGDSCIKDLKLRYNQYIRECQISYFLRLTDLGRKYLVNKADTIRRVLISGSSKARYDSRDVMLIKELSENAKTPLVMLSKKLGIGVGSLAKRIKRLENEKLITGYKTYINDETLGYFTYKVDLTLNSYKDYGKILSYVQNHPSVTYINEVLSGRDLELDIEVRDKNECVSFIKEIKTRFGTIRSYGYFSYRFVKERFMPESL